MSPENLPLNTAIFAFLYAFLGSCRVADRIGVKLRVTSWPFGAIFYSGRCFFSSGRYFRNLCLVEIYNGALARAPPGKGEINRISAIFIVGLSPRTEEFATSTCGINEEIPHWLASVSGEQRLISRARILETYGVIRLWPPIGESNYYMARVGITGVCGNLGDDFTIRGSMQKSQTSCILQEIDSRNLANAITLVSRREKGIQVLRL